MTDQWRRCSFEFEGEPHRLTSREAAARAIDSGRVTRDTMITVMAADGEVFVQRAGTIAQFAPIFGDPLPLEELEVPEETAAPEPEVADEASEAPPAPEPATTPAPEAKPAPATPPDSKPEVKAEPDTKAAVEPKEEERARAIAEAKAKADAAIVAAEALRRKHAGEVPLPVKLLLGAIGLVAVFALITMLWGGKTYVQTDLVPYAQPGVPQASGTPLLQGTQIDVSDADQPGWLRIDGGGFDGLFVPQSAIDSDVPPAIDRSASVEVTVRNGLSLFAAPEDGALQIGHLGPQERIVALGRLPEAPGDNWYLFAFAGPDDLPVAAYGRLSPDARSRTVAPPSAPASEAAAAVDLPPPSPTPRASPSPSATPSLASAAPDRCSAMRRALDRLACQDRSVGAAIQSLTASWQAARRRMRSGGTPVGPLNTFLAPAQDCATPACARKALALQKSSLDSMQPPEFNSVRQTAVQPVHVPQPATPRGNRSNWITANDYPRAAERDGAQGTVGYLLAIDPYGRVQNCEIRRSSGHAALDETTCRQLQRRARFNPATDQTGQPTTGSFAGTVRWVLPQ